MMKNIQYIQSQGYPNVFHENVLFFFFLNKI